MANKIKQLRFNSTNKPSFPEGEYWSVNLIEDYGVVTQLGIYALPGTLFQINQEHYSDYTALQINGSGIFSVNTKDYPIRSLQIHKESFQNSLETSQTVIIDLIYEGVQDNG